MERLVEEGVEEVPEGREWKSGERGLSGKGRSEKTAGSGTGRLSISKKGIEKGDEREDIMSPLYIT